MMSNNTLIATANSLYIWLPAKDVKGSMSENLKHLLKEDIVTTNKKSRKKSEVWGTIMGVMAVVTKTSKFR